MNENLKENSILSHYHIISKIGKGGMGEVYLAEDTKLDRRVALKILPTEFAEDTERMSRFVREAKSASALNHPNIITIYEINEFEGTHFIATEFIDGKTLDKHSKDNPLDLEAILEIAIQVASALDEAHSAGIVHRDIKPDNIMIRSNGLAKILDFGIAKLSVSPKSVGEEDATAIQQPSTSPGMIIGTANYMSPEQARGKAVDQQTDIFSFGVVFYEMLSGKSPFAGGTVSDTLAAVLMKEPPPLENIPPSLAAIVAKILQKDKRNRYKSANELLDELKKFKRDLEIQNHLRRTSSPDLEDQKTQILKAQTAAGENSQSDTRNLRSIVVLPFTNIGGNEEDEYFSDGLTEEIISDLSNIRVLRVISRNSAMKLKGTTKDLKTITEELNVRYVLDGSVRKAGPDLRISVHLIDGISDANLWAEKYTGSLDDIFEIQENVSHSIAEALKITLTTGEIEQIEERPISDAQAYDLYLRARAKFMQGDPSALDRSIELLKQGLEIIGENELLHAALGYTYYFYFRWISKLDENFLQLANECLEKIIALNPVSSHGFALKGHLSYSRGDIAESIRSLKKAIELQPTNTEALLWLSANSSYVGQTDASQKYADELYLLDPLTPVNVFVKGIGSAYRGEFSESSRWIDRALEMDSSSPLMIWTSVVVEAWDGRINEAISHINQLAEISPDWVYTQQGLFLKHALLGEKELALKHYTPDFDKEAKYDCHFALHVAHCFALIGEAEKAIDFLEIAVRAGMVNHRFLSELDPLLENIRTEPRFVSLMTEAERLFEEIDNSIFETDFRDEAKPLEEAGTQILQTPSTAEKSSTSMTGSAEGFRVAVLPFKYRGSNAELESLAEGLSEEIVTGLSRFPYLRVISRNASFGGEIDTGERRTSDEEFGIRYVLEGSLRQVGTTVRVAVQLVDTATGEHLWAETYDRKLDPERIFEIQDELVSRVVSTIADWHGVLVHSMAGSLRTKDKQEITPDEAVLYVFGYIERLSPEEHLAARDLMERIVEEFPDRGNCWAMLAILYCNEYMYGFNLRPDPLGRALAAAQRAVELEPANYLASQSLAFAYFFRREFAAFETMANKTLALNRMCGGTVAILGVFFACSGEWERGCRLSREAMELNPHFPGWYRLPFIFNAYRLKNYREALDEAQNINIPNYFWTLVMRTASLGQLGERKKAKEALDELLASRPDIAGKEPEEFGHWLDAEFVEDLMEGLHKAGFKITFAEEQKTPQTQPKQTPTPETKDTIGSESSETYSEQAFRVAVLPFIFRGTSDELEALAASLSEEIVTGLSRFSYLRIIAHGSTLGYKSEGGDVQEVSEELGVRYVIEGSLRQVGRTIRLAVKLVDTTTGEHLWAETYDRDFSAEAVFELQDELVPQIVSTVADWYGVLPHSMSEAVRLKSSEQLNSYEAVLRSFGYFERIGPEEHSAVRDALERAVEQVPGNADAWAMLSMIYGEEHRFGFNEKPDSLERSLEAAKKAVDAAHGNHFAWLAMAQALFFRKEFDSFRDAAERVVSLNSLDGASVEYVGHLIAFSGDWERGCELSERARLLNPNHPGWYWSVFFLDAYRREDYENARSFLLKAALRGGGAYIYEQVLFASLYGQLEDTGEAKATLKKIEEISPSYLLTVEREFAKWYLPELVEQLMEGLRQAGLEIVSETDKKEQKTQILEAKTPDTKSKDTNEKTKAKTAINQPDTAEENAEVESTSKQKNNPKSKAQNPKSKWWLFGLLGLIVLVIGFFGYNYFASNSKQIESIAVMPFINESENEDVEYLSDGMTEAMTLIQSKMTL
ncbi:MAG: protein kinase [Pyrinomonadaceae bacterium]